MNSSFEHKPGSKAPVKKNLIEKYRPTQIGQGSENFIYEAKGHPDVVIKVNKFSLVKSIDAQRQKKPDENQANLDEALQESRRAYQELRQVFGDHVLKQKQFVVETPYYPHMVKDMEFQALALGIDLPKDGHGRASTIVTVQERSKIFQDEDRLSLDGGLLEIQLAKKNTIDVPEEHWKSYATVTSALLNAEQASRSGLTQEELEALYVDMGLSKLLKKASDDESFKRTLADFQKKAVEHAKVSGDVLDIIGKDNIIFVKKDDGTWDYTLADAIFPLESKTLEKAKTIINGVKPGQKISWKERLSVRWAVGYVRQINALGKILGTDAYIDFSSDKIPGTDISIAELVTARNEKTLTSNAPKRSSLFSPLKGR